MRLDKRFENGFKFEIYAYVLLKIQARIISENYKKKYLYVNRNKMRAKIFFFKTFYAAYKKLLEKLKFE